MVLVLFAAVSWAQDKSQSSSSASNLSVRAKSSLPDPGAIRDGVYRNSAFGFSYKLPYGWVDRTADMQDDSAEASKSRVLLAIFERPPEARDDRVNSAVVIAAEPLSAYPGVKTAAEYLESLSALTTAKGFQTEEEPREFFVGATKMVRGDFSKPRGPVTLRQTSLVMLARSYAISFTFIGGSEDDGDELIERLGFAPRKPQR